MTGAWDDRGRPLSRRAALVAIVSACATLPAGALAQATDLAVGQEWSIKTASPAKVIIGRIEPWPAGGTAVSVSLIDVPSDHGPIVIGHLPFDKPALVASLDQLLATGVAPPDGFEDGYRQWKSARGGIFTLSVAQVIVMMFAMLNKAGQPAPPPPGQPQT